jgi:hypothetical protein
MTHERSARVFVIHEVAAECVLIPGVIEATKDSIIGAIL